MRQGVTFEVPGRVRFVIDPEQGELHYEELVNFQPTDLDHLRLACTLAGLSPVNYFGDPIWFDDSEFWWDAVRESHYPEGAGADATPTITRFPLCVVDPRKVGDLAQVQQQLDEMIDGLALR